MRFFEMKHLITAFTPDGDYLAILLPVGVVKIWSTKSGDLLGEWKPADGDSGGPFSCMACSFVGTKRRKERGTCLLAFGTVDGHVFATDVFTGEIKWRAADSFPGGVSGLTFANKGRSFHVVGMNGMVSSLNSETGAIIGEFKASKKQISTLAFSYDEKYLAVADGRLRVLSLESGKEIVKISNKLGHVQRASMSDGANALVTFGSGEKHLQVWKLDMDAGTSTLGPALSMKHAPLSIQCKDGCGESGTVVLAMSKSGAYVWHLKTQLEEEVSPTKITCKVNEDEALQNAGNAKKDRASIIAARLQDLDAEKQMKALISYGSIEHPQFTFVDITVPGEDVFINVEAANSDPKSVAGKDLEATVTPKKSKKENKKRAASELDQSTSGDIVDIGNGEAADGVLVDGDLNEPTMGEKLSTLNLADNDTVTRDEKDVSLLDVKPPSADSVHVILKQALRADDRILLLDCLYTQDVKVISKSISQLNSSDVLKLLQSLTSIIQSRGAILASALPWLRHLLLQHASGIMSQQSSLSALNSLYQLIESRVSSFQSALQLSSALDVLYTGIVDDDDSGDTAAVPFIFEDNDSSDEEESDNEAMETDDHDSEDDGVVVGGDANDERFGGLSDLEGSDGMNE